MSPVRNIRFAAIYHLAKFVGSTISDSDICCLALAGDEFMGSHDRTSPIKKHSQELLSSRYGKWKQRTDSNPKLLQDLYKYGGNGLKGFGYEPLRALADADMPAPSGFLCSKETVTCKQGS